MLTRQYYGCSYTHYLQVLIDRICKNQNEIVQAGDEVTLDLCIANTVTKVNTDINISQVTRNNPEDEAERPARIKMHDFKDKERTIRFLPQVSTDFEFIGPDRSPVLIDTIDKYIDIANVILDTGVPNYKQARIPIQSGLNIEAWDKYLREFPKKKLLQYIKFGYPLSLSNQLLIML